MENAVGKYTQANRSLALTTPLGPDALLLEKVSGAEALSELFRFQLDLLAEKGTPVPFEGILGQKVRVELRLRNGEKTRYIHGIVNRISQGHRVRGTESDQFTRYSAEVVPECWLLTKNIRSRIFQSMAVPDILSQVLGDEWKLNVSFAAITGDYYPRDYCVQYRESDFAFVSRLMEEEGIYYFFVHSADGHQMVLADVPDAHPPIAEVDAVQFDEEESQLPRQDRIQRWIKTQEIRSGKVTLWDHCFELPQSNLEAKSTVVGQTVTTGDVDHALQAGGNQRLEIYDFPGGYAQRFDGVNPSGAERPDDLKQIFKDNQRTATIRMQQETVPGLTVSGSSTCWHFAAGHTFNLEGHFDADDLYMLTRVEHHASIEGAYTTGKKESTLAYTNKFQCMPFDPALPYRPQRVTAKPKIEGAQTALVTGVAEDGQNYFTDKYGRVKVQFYWDRDGSRDADSSCWIRVAQIWAGKGWGAFFWPRPGHEVVIAFEDGDPDRPLIIGSVYNAENMPPFDPATRPMISGIKSCTVRETADKYFNGIVFVDEEGREHLSIHSERTMLFYAEYSKHFLVGDYHNANVPQTRMSTVGALPGIGGGTFSL
jgi:type VI secretion system secreted protein VgrG